MASRCVEIVSGHDGLDELPAKKISDDSGNQASSGPKGGRGRLDQRGEPCSSPIRESAKRAQLPSVNSALGTVDRFLLGAIGREGLKGAPHATRLCSQVLLARILTEVPVGAARKATEGAGVKMRLGRAAVIVMALSVPAIVTFGSPSSAAKPTPATSASAASAAPSAAVPAKVPVAASASGAAPAASSTAGPAPGEMDGATYAVRLRDLEQRIDELKEQIRRSHTRLSLLSDTILGGGVAGSRAEVQFENQMSGAFRLTRAVFVLDGAVQYNKADESGVLSEQPTLPIYTGSIPPGDHTLQVLLQLQGNGYGVFSYLKGYRFEVRSSHSFTAVEGKTMQVQAIAYEKGGVTTPLEERPAVRYMEKPVALTQKEADSGGSGPASAPKPAVSGGFSIGGK